MVTRMPLDTTRARRDDRIEIRASAAEKQLLAAAAAHARMDLTTFILSGILPAARALVEQAETIRLSARDSARVLALLERPRAPTPRLRRAVRLKYGR